MKKTPELMAVINDTADGGWISLYLFEEKSKDAKPAAEINDSIDF